MSKSQCILLVMLFGMIGSTFLLQRRAVAFFSPDGSDPIMTAVYVVAVVGFGVGAMVVRFRSAKDKP